MSQDNVEIVLRGIPGSDVDFAQQLRDDEMWAIWAEAVAPFFDPQLECVLVGLPGGDKNYAGLGGFRDALLEWYAPWATYRLEVREAIDLGDRVVAFVDNFGRLKGSAAEITFAATGVYTVHDSRIARAEFYADRAEALKAVGLEE